MSTGDVPLSVSEQVRQQAALDLPPGTPVQIIRGGTYDAERRPLHFIEVIAGGGRVEFAYLYGAVPAANEDG